MLLLPRLSASCKLPGHPAAARQHSLRLPAAAAARVTVPGACRQQFKWHRRSTPRVDAAASTASFSKLQCGREPGPAFQRRGACRAQGQGGRQAASDQQGRALGNPGGAACKQRQGGLVAGWAGGGTAHPANARASMQHWHLACPPLCYLTPLINTDRAAPQGCFACCLHCRHTPRFCSRAAAASGTATSWQPLLKKPRCAADCVPLGLLLLLAGLVSAAAAAALHGPAAGAAVTSSHCPACPACPVRPYLPACLPRFNVPCCCPAPAALQPYQVRGCAADQPPPAFRGGSDPGEARAALQCLLWMLCLMW